MNELDEHLLLSVYRHLRERVTPGDLQTYRTERAGQIRAVLDLASAKGDTVVDLADAILDEAGRDNAQARDLVLMAQTWGEPPLEWIEDLTRREP